ncbi:MAG: hypothetical protein NTZ96_04675 [Burkholderiales bacterium]|nr:hypothetical protein [Burkholderiales bacterium]
MFMLKVSKGLLAIFVLLVAACTTTNVGLDGETRYRYSAFDFSGKSWVMQKQRCEALDMKPKHLDTECGLLLCTSRYGCEAKAN